MSQVATEQAQRTSGARAPVVRHVWMPSRHSLCDMAAQRALSPEAEAEINALVAEAPVCGACAAVAAMIAQRVADMQEEAGGRVEPGPAESLEALRGSTWTWAVSALRN